MALFLLKALKQDPQGKYIPANGVNAFFMFRDTQKDLGIFFFKKKLLCTIILLLLLLTTCNYCY